MTSQLAKHVVKGSRSAHLVGKRSLLLSAIGFATTAGVSYGTLKAEEAYSQVDSIADSFVCTALAYKEMQKLQQQTTSNRTAAGSSTDLHRRLLRSASELDRRVDWSLKKHNLLASRDSFLYTFTTKNINCAGGVFGDGDTQCNTACTASLSVYRLEWMKVYLRNLCAQVELQLQQPQPPSDKLEKPKQHKAMYTYEEESSLLYDVQVDDHFYSDYFDASKAAAAHIQLDQLLPPLKTKGKTDNNSKHLLHERHQQYLSKLMIPKNQYETTFRKLLDMVLAECTNMIPELQTATLKQEYIDDVKNSCEAFVQLSTTNTRQSEMVVNLARSISYDKAQQLAVHELTHYIQFVLMEDYLYQYCPELRVANDVLELGPLSFLMEGGAEFFVEAFYDGSCVARDRQSQLHQPFMVPQHILRLPYYDANTILSIENITWFGLWSTCTRIARDLHNKNQNDATTTTTTPCTNNPNKETAQQELLQQALKRNDSWPNADFFEQVGAYSLGYGFGKELIKGYCQNQAKTKGTSVMEEYIRFMKQPITPSNMQYVLLKLKQSGGKH